MTTVPRARETYLSKLDLHSCRRLLASESVGRISWASSSGQLILPVTYVYLDQIIGFRTTPDGTLAELARPTQVAFEVDSLDSRRNEAVSVVVQGVTRAAERDGRTPEWTEDVVPWGGGRRPLAIEIEITKITGRRIQRGPDRG